MNSILASAAAPSFAQETARAKPGSRFEGNDASYFVGATLSPNGCLVTAV
jgi:hypothetical protein